MTGAAMGKCLALWSGDALYVVEIADGLRPAAEQPGFVAGTVRTVAKVSPTSTVRACRSAFVGRQLS